MASEHKKTASKPEDNLSVIIECIEDTVKEAVLRLSEAQFDSMLDLMNREINSGLADRGKTYIDVANKIKAEIKNAQANTSYLASNGKAAVIDMRYQSYMEDTLSDSLKELTRIIVTGSKEVEDIATRLILGSYEIVKIEREYGKDSVKVVVSLKAGGKTEPDTIIIPYTPLKEVGSLIGKMKMLKFLSGESGTDSKAGYIHLPQQYQGDEHLVNLYNKLHGTYILRGTDKSLRALLTGDKADIIKWRSTPSDGGYSELIFLLVLLHMVPVDGSAKFNPNAVIDPHNISSLLKRFEIDGQSRPKENSLGAMRSGFKKYILGSGDFTPPKGQLGKDDLIRKIKDVYSIK
jgi:hypothetical protein